MDLRKARIGSSIYNTCAPRLPRVVCERTFSDGLVKVSTCRRRKGDERDHPVEKSETRTTERMKRERTLVEPRAPIQIGCVERQIFCCDARIHNVIIIGPMNRFVVSVGFALPEKLSVSTLLDVCSCKLRIDTNYKISFFERCEMMKRQWILLWISFWRMHVDEE